MSRAWCCTVLEIHLLQRRVKPFIGLSKQWDLSRSDPTKCGGGKSLSWLLL